MSYTLLKMHIFEAAILGLIQGVTEFIPISSSGHLIIAEKLFGLGGGNFAFDTMLNIGTLLALVLYFRKDILELVGIGPKPFNKKFILGLVVATIPGVLVGVLVQSAAETYLRSELVVVTMLASVALCMLWAERHAQQHKKTEASITRSDSVAIGLSQALAFIPGTSRSGITLVAGMARGLTRELAARYSFFLALPILGGGVLKVLLSEGTISSITSDPGVYAIGIIVSFVSGYTAIAYLLRYVARHSLAVFAYYRLALAAILVVLVILS